MILRPVAAICYPIVARALLVGYGLNAVMPARLGELFRAEFVKKTCGLSRAWGLTSIVIERLFDRITVVCCLGVGLLLSAAAKPNAGLLINVLAAGSALFGAVLLAAFFLSGSMLSRIVGRFPGLSAQLAMVQQGLEILLNLADIRGRRDYSHYICTGCAHTVASLRGGRADARVFRHPRPPRRSQGTGARPFDHHPGL